MFKTVSNSDITLRGPSPTIWGSCPVDEINADKNKGIIISDDFEYTPLVFAAGGAQANWGRYKAFTSATTTLAPDGAAGAGIRLLQTGATDDLGGSFGTVQQPFIINASSGRVWFEARIKIASIAVSIADVFVGMIELATLSATVPITAAAGVMSNNNWVGFHRPGTAVAGDGSKCRFTYKADGVTAVFVETIASCFAADTYVKLGFTYDPTTNILTSYRNGTARSTTYTMAAAAGTDFPNDVNLGLVFAGLAVGATNADQSIDWWQCAQEFIGL
jgi:hypothetical protein